MHQISGRIFAVALTTFLGIHTVQGQTPTGGGVDLALYLVMGVAGFAYVLSAAPISRRLPSIRVDRQSGIWALQLIPAEIGRRWTKRRLRKRGARVSRGVFQMLADYKANDPARDPWWYHHPNWDALDQAEKTRIFNEHNAKGSAHTGQLMGRYNVEYSAEALALYDEFESRGATGSVDRHDFEHPTNPLGLEGVAQQLGVWAKRV